MGRKRGNASPASIKKIKKNRPSSSSFFEIGFSLCGSVSLSLSLLAAGSSSSGGPLLLLPLPPLPLLPRSTTAELQDRGAASPQIMHSLWNNSAPPPKRTTLKSILVTVETFSPIEYLSTSAPSLVLYPVLRRLLVTNLGLPGFDHLCSTSSKML